MKKLSKLAIAIMATLLCWQTVCYASTDTDVSTDVIYVENLENQSIMLEAGKEYKLSFPISDEDWRVSEIKLQVGEEWIEIEKGDKNNQYLEVKQIESWENRLTIKAVCKDSITLRKISVVVQNERTGEIIDYTLDVVNVNNLLLSNVIDNTSNFDTLQLPKISEKFEEPKLPEVSDKPESIDKLEGTGKPGVSGKPEKPVELEEPSEPEEPEPKPEEPKLIILDTSNWRFEKVEGTYDGTTEFVALVTGLPDFVTPMYVDNKRTNAGSNKAIVSFQIPKGYALPEGFETMETLIDIAKAKIDTSTIELDRHWMQTDLLNGTLSIMPPSWERLEGVQYTYIVNGKEYESYTVTDTGVYSVLVNYTLTEEMAENYELTNTTTKGVYWVQPNQSSNPKYNVYIDEVTRDDGKIEIEIWYDLIDDTYSTEGLQWKLQYDNNVLEMESSTKGSSMSFVMQDEYIEDVENKVGNGVAMGSFYTWATIQKVVFNVLDENAKDIVINLTDIMASGSYQDYKKEYTDSTGIVLSQEAKLIGVTLPSASKTTSIKKASQTICIGTENVTETETETSEAIGVGTENVTETETETSEAIGVGTENITEIETETSEAIGVGTENVTETETETSEAIGVGTENVTETETETSEAIGVGTENVTEPETETVE